MKTIKNLHFFLRIINKHLILNCAHYTRKRLHVVHSTRLVEQLTNDFSKTKKVSKQRENNNNIIYYLEKKCYKNEEGHIY